MHNARGLSTAISLAFMLLFALPLLAHSQIPSIAPASNQSAAFLDGNIVSITYTKNYVCTPSLFTIYGNISYIENITECGVVHPTSVIGTLPIWAITPSFAGYSIYGYTEYGSTPSGYAVYLDNSVQTDCGAGNTSSACPLTPPYRFDPLNFKVEYSLGIYNGTHGLPQGLLPMPAHSYVLLNDYGGQPIPVYTVFVRVFDPNIFPNATTGQCKQVAPSNLSNATGNCLTSFDALRRAAQTKNSYIPEINSANPLWYIESNSTSQIVIVSPGQQNNITGISNLLYPNTNIYLFIKTNRTNFYRSQAVTIAQNAKNSGALVALVGVIVAIVAGANVAWFVAKHELKMKRLQKKPRR